MVTMKIKKKYTNPLLTICNLDDTSVLLYVSPQYNGDAEHEDLGGKPTATPPSGVNASMMMHRETVFEYQASGATPFNR